MHHPSHARTQGVSRQPAAARAPGAREREGDLGLVHPPRGSAEFAVRGGMVRHAHQIYARVPARAAGDYDAHAQRAIRPESERVHDGVALHELGLESGVVRDDAYDLVFILYDDERTHERWGADH